MVARRCVVGPAAVGATRVGAGSLLPVPGGLVRAGPGSPSTASLRLVSGGAVVGAGAGVSFWVPVFCRAGCFSAGSLSSVRSVLAMSRRANGWSAGSPARRHSSLTALRGGRLLPLR